MEIKKGTNQFYIGKEENQSLARITFQVDGNTLIVDHTIVSEELQGQGIAKKLLNHLLDYARKNNYKIVPVCPYVKAAFEKNPSWSDLLA